MLVPSLYQFLLTPVAKTPRSRMIFWLTLSLTFSVLYYIPAFQQAFSSPYVVQDDARQHVFWMLRFTDPGLFPNNFLADYFQSVAPLGYTTVYRIGALFGLDAMLLHKLLPPVLLLITTAYAFWLCLEILPIPLAGFLSTLLLNQSLWMRDDVISATPTAFVYPIFVAFLYYLLRGSLIPCLIAIALQGLFYPQCMFIFCVILLLRLLRWEGWRPRLSRNRQDYLFCAAGLGTAFLVILPYVLRSNEFGPVVTGAQARTISAFQENRWSEFFVDRPYFSKLLKKYWVCGRRAGFMPPEWCGIDYGAFNAMSPPKSPSLRVSGGLPQIIFGLAFIVLPFFPKRFPLVQQLTASVSVLFQTLAASLLMFLASHALLFKLHLPSRYTEHSLRIVAALAAGLAIVILLDAVFQRYLRTSRPVAWRSAVALGCTALVAVGLLAYPQFLRLRKNPFPIINYQVGQDPALYQFFEQQPEDTVIASIAPEINSLPSYTRRSILVGGEGFTLPYHLGYYKESLQRTNDLVQAQYSPDLEQVKAFIQKYGVDFWLLEPLTFKRRYANENPTLTEFDDLGTYARTRLKSSKRPALSQISQRCYAYQDQLYTVVDANCVLKLPNRS